MQSVRPVKHSRFPRYPIREEALACPGLLEKLPERWRKSRQAAAAAGLLAAMAAAASGCDKSALAGTPIVKPSMSVEETEAYAGVPAPTPIVSEAEACQDIMSAARAWLPGLSASYKLADGDKPVTYITCDNSGVSAVYRIVNTNDTKVDLFDASSGVGFEYVDEADRSDHDVKTSEYTLSKPEKDHSYVLVFPYDNYYMTDEASAKADIAKRVKDFIEWLKAEGVI